MATKMLAPALRRLLFGCLALLAVPAAIAETRAPRTVVEEFHAALIATMNEAAELGFAGRYDRLLPVLDASFDFPAIAKVVIGRHWQDLDAAQRAEFIRTFTELSVATYATNFAAFAGERFVTVGDEKADGRVVVRTELVQADGDEVGLNYLLHQRDGEWRIVNVIAQGVSDLALKRVEYTAVIKAEGIESLIRRLAEKVVQLGQAS